MVFFHASGHIQDPAEILGETVQARIHDHEAILEFELRAYLLAGTWRWSKQLDIRSVAHRCDLSCRYLLIEEVVEDSLGGYDNV
jgi:hypothetical protein